MIAGVAREPRVLLVTVTYGDRSHLVTETLRRAFESGVDSAIVVMNGAGRETRESVSSAEESIAGRILTVDLPVNRGSAIGFGAGISAAARSDADLIWILDDDNWAAPDALHLAVESWRGLQGHGEMSAVMCVRSEELDALRSGAVMRELRAPAGNFCGVDVFERLRGRLRRRSRRPVAVERLMRVPYGPYGGLLMRREDLGLVPGPDGRFVLYSDDYDWTARLSAAGVAFHLDTHALIEDPTSRWGGTRTTSHFHGMVGSSDRSRVYYSLRNSMYFSWVSTRTLVERTRVLLNAGAFSAWVLVQALRRRRIGFVVVYARAMLDAARGLRISSTGLPTGIS